MRLPSTPILALSALLFLAGGASAQSTEWRRPWYLEIGGGLTSPMESSGAPGGGVDFDEGYGVSALVGYNVLDISERLTLSTQVEFFFNEADVSSSDFLSAGASNPETIDSTSFFANGILDFDLSEKVSLYFGGGVGYATSIEVSSFDEVENQFQVVDDSGLAFQGKVGLRSWLGGDSNFSWSLGYRYFQTEDVAMEDDFGVGFDLEHAAHVIELAFRWGI